MKQKTLQTMIFIAVKSRSYLISSISYDITTVSIQFCANSIFCIFLRILVNWLFLNELQQESLFEDGEKLTKGQRPENIFSILDIFRNDNRVFGAQKAHNKYLLKVENYTSTS